MAIELVEHRTSEVALPASTARGLASVPGRPFDVRPGDAEGTWKITPGSIVGVHTIGDQRVHVRPKVGIRNLLALMDISARTERWRRELFEYDVEPDLLTAMVTVFVRALDRSLAQGVRRDYERRDERLLALRGRIDVPAMARSGRPLTSVPCIFDEHTTDIPLNRLLLAAIRRAERVPGLPPKVRQELHRHHAALGDVSIDADPLGWLSTWEPTRLDRHYEPAVRIGALLLRHLSIADRAGSAGATTFLVDMNELVESFISEHLRRMLAGTLTVSAQHRSTLDDEGRVPVRPDLVFLRGATPVFVADVKYKSVATMDQASNADLYQLCAYAAVLGIDRGALITCLPEGASSGLDAITVRRMGIRLEVWPIDLSVEPSAIHAGVQEVADRLCAMTDRVGSASGW